MSGTSLAPSGHSFEGQSCAHEVQFYTQDEYLVRGLATFISDALKSGQSAVVIATEPHRLALAGQLAVSGIDVQSAADQGRYTAVDADAMLREFMEGDSPDAKRFAEVAGALVDRACEAATSLPCRVVAFGEMVALLWESGNREAAIRLEALWNDLGKTRAFNLRCAYPMRNFSHPEDADQFRTVCAHHSAVMPDESYAQLTTEADKLRNISQLQQRAYALDSQTAKNSLMAQEIEDYRRTHAELTEFSGQLMRTQDDERHHVARQLHEAISQDLVALQIGLQMVEKEASALKRTRFLQEARDAVGRCIRELRSLTYILHPPLLDDVGLASAISWYAGCFTERTGIKVALDLPATNLRFPRRIELALFRVLQEVLNSFERHAHTASVAVRVESDGTQAILDLAAAGPMHTVAGSEAIQRDNSSTISPLALMSIRQRLSELGGRLELEADAAGTHLRALAPISLLN